MATITNNLATIPSFENGLTHPGNGSGFFDNNGTVALVTDDAKATGTNCVSVSSSTAFGGGVLFELLGDIGAGVFSFDVWLESGATDWYYRLVNQSSSVIFADWTFFTATSAVQRIVVPFTTAADPAYMTLLLGRGTAVAGEIRVDAVRIGEDGEYFDGDTTDTATVTYDWVGTVGGSASTRTSTLNLTTRRIRQQFQLRPY